MSWETVRLGDVISTLKGFAFKSSHYTESGHPIVRASNFTMDSISADDLKYYSYEEALQYKKYSLKKSDVLIQTVGSWEYNPNSVVGKVVRVPEQLEGALLNQNIVKIMPNDAVDNIFLYYRLKCDDFSKYNIGNAVGAANQASITLDTIRDFTFECPEIIVQKHIANILSTYDDLIENNQKQIKLLQEASQRLYKEWFVDLHFPGYENTPIIDGVPKGWIESAIADLCEKINAGGTPSRRNETFWNDATIKWYKTQELQDCWLIDSDEKISVDGQKNSSAKFFPKNTILMAIYASPTLGRLGVLDSEATCNQAALCLKADETKISWQWLYEKLYELREHYNGIARGAGQQNISGEVVKQTKVLCPTKETMDKFTHIVSPWFEKRRMLQKQNIGLIESRDCLLPKLMSGEIEV